MSSQAAPACFPTVWVQWFPYAGYNMDFWVTVAKRVRKKGIRKKDRAAVVRVCRQVHAMMNKRVL